MDNASITEFMVVGGRYVTLEWKGASQIIETWEPDYPSQFTKAESKEYARGKTRLIERIQQAMRASSTNELG